MTTFTKLSIGALALALASLAGTAQAASLYRVPAFNSTNVTFKYTMGYRFTPDKPITVTDLGGAFYGTKNVYLYDGVTGGVLASASVAGGGTTYKYKPVTPVSLAPGHPYTVAVALAGSGGNFAIVPMPISVADATVDASCYLANAGPTSTGDPCLLGSQSTTVMYGVADLLYYRAPTITGQPASMTVDAGQSAFFIVNTSSSCGTITTRWQRDGVDLSDDGIYTGTQTAILHVNGATASRAGTYRAVVSCANGGGTTYSRPATLVVKPLATVTTLPPLVGNFGYSGCAGGGCTLWWAGTNGPINATQLTLTPDGGTPIDVTGLTQKVVYPATSKLYTLTATNAAGSFSRRVMVPVGGYTATIDSCRTIDMPGRYLVTTSISSASDSEPCLDVRDNHDIYIDCAAGVVVSGRKGPSAVPGWTSPSGAIRLSNVHGFAIRGCQFRESASSPEPFLASIIDSSSGYVFNSQFGSASVTSDRQGVQTYQSSYITFASNTVYNTIELHYNSFGNSIVSSTITNVFPGTVAGPGTARLYTTANVWAWGAEHSGTQVVNCTLDGGATGAFIPGSTVYAGADDGIVGTGPNGLFAHNIMRNYFDAALEWTVPTFSSTIYANYIENAGYAALSWNRQGDMIGWLIRDNYIDSSEWPGANHGIHLSSEPSPGQTAHFQYNNFDHNLIVNGATSLASDFLTSGAWIVGGNLFSNNDFNYDGYPGIGAPVFTTPYLPGIATDGGGNLCAHPNPPGYPLVCN